MPVRRKGPLQRVSRRETVADLFRARTGPYYLDFTIGPANGAELAGFFVFLSHLPSL